MKVDTNLARMTAAYWALSLADRRRLSCSWPYAKPVNEMRDILQRHVDDMPVALFNCFSLEEQRRKRLNRSVGGL